MSQFDLFGAKRLARRTDPETSKWAAHAIVQSGSLANLQQRCVDLVTLYPGKTAAELSQAAGDRDPRKVNRRLAEVERKGLVIRGEPRPCTLTGRRAHTWLPKEETS